MYGKEEGFLTYTSADNGEVKISTEDSSVKNRNDIIANVYVNEDNISGYFLEKNKTGYHRLENIENNFSFIITPGTNTTSKESSLKDLTSIIEEFKMENESLINNSLNEISPSKEIGTDSVEPTYGLTSALHVLANSVGVWPFLDSSLAEGWASTIYTSNSVYIVHNVRYVTNGAPGDGVSLWYRYYNNPQIAWHSPSNSNGTKSISSSFYIDSTIGRFEAAATSTFVVRGVPVPITTYDDIPIR